jgi:hypothetical protein
MATSLPTLGDDDIDAAVQGALGIGNRTDRMQHSRAGRLSPRD